MLTPIADLSKTVCERSTLSLRVEAMLIASLMTVSAAHMVHNALSLGWGITEQGIYGCVGALLTWRSLH